MMHKNKVLSKNINVQLSVDEFNSLRNEAIERISIINNQASNAATIILTIWAAGFGLLGIQLSAYSKLSDSFLIILSIGQIFAFQFSIFMLIPMAIKSGENLRQIVSTGVYMRVFFDFISQSKLRSNNDQLPLTLFAWETADKLMNTVITKKSKYRFRDRLINSEYVILGILSFLFLSGILILNYELFIKYLSCYILIPTYILIVFLALFMIIFIHNFSSSGNNLSKVVEEYTRKYLILAVEMGLLKHNELYKAWEQLNPHREINEEKYKKYFS